MKTLLVKLLIIVITIFPKILFGQADNKIIFGEKEVIHSEILGEDKEYWIHLPMDYHTNSKTYPVLYITDGDEHFFLASGVTQFMSSQYKVPEMIIVAIFHKDRNHDLTPTHCLTDFNGIESNGLKESGGGKKLLEFLGQELIKNIDNKYRTNSYRILAGHSLGGLFSVYAYLSSNDLFKAFIAMDPALYWDDNFCERTLKSLTSQSPNLKNKLYISSAHNAAPGKPDKSPFRKSQESFYKELEIKGVDNSKHDYFEQENHMTVPYQSLYAGLAYIFSDYYLFGNPKFSEDVSSIQEHYQQASNLYGIEFIPPEGLMEMLGNYFLLDRNDDAKAMEFFKFNTTHYPSSGIAFENLAKAYEASGNVKEAITNLKKSLELNPGNKDTQKLLNELESH